MEPQSKSLWFKFLEILYRSIIDLELGAIGNVEPFTEQFKNYVIAHIEPLLFYLIMIFIIR
jgi:hypothetical protein